MRKILCLLACSISLFAGEAELRKAGALYGNTDYREAIRALGDPSATGAAAYELAGRSYFMLGEYKKASELLDQAFQLDPKNSDYSLWLGRAYGRRAETASPILAPINAGKARDYFEKAVELNGRNQEALNDLFDYYLQAPGFLGGGYEKAAAVAKRISQIDAAEGHFALAQLAQKRREYDTAEQQLRHAVTLAPKQVGRIVDLAKYLAQRGRYAESDAAFEQAERIAPNAPRVLFAEARTYIETNRRLDEAKALLEKYLQSRLTPEDPPKTDARKLLRKVNGD